MSARRRSTSKSARSKSGNLALPLGAICAGTAAFTTLITVVFVSRTLGAAISGNAAAIVQRGWILGLVMSVISGLVVGLVAYLRGAGIASRLTELGLGLAKIGRGAGEVRVRVTGNDEISSLGRGLQYLATDLAAMQKEAEQSGGGLGANMDPMVREMRDRTLPQGFDEVEGFELDGALADGTRGGMEYFDCVVKDGKAVLFLVSHEGAGTISAIAARTARDELVRALNAGANGRKALSHTNRVMHKQLPKGACAKVCLLELGQEEVKLYQAGFRQPLLVCRAGQVEEFNAEGLALGLDEGPVFEKGLRSAVIAVAQGTRLVIANDAALRLDDFVELCAEHSPKHTAPFMNMVLGTREGDAGEGGLREDVVLLTAKRW